jgi:hypothetical protein
MRKVVENLTAIPGIGASTANAFLDLQPGPARRHASYGSRDSPRGATGGWAGRDRDAKAGPRTVAGVITVPQHRVNLSLAGH